MKMEDISMSQAAKQNREIQNLIDGYEAKVRLNKKKLNHPDYCLYYRDYRTQNSEWLEFIGLLKSIKTSS